METESAPKVVKSDAEWRAELTPAEYQVLRKAGTERPFVGEYTDTKTEGVYTCRACGAELFRSDAKFESHCGWPSFFTPLAGDAVIERVDTTLGMRRVEVVCAQLPQPPRARVRGRGLLDADGPAVLHQLDLDAAGAEGALVDQLDGAGQAGSAGEAGVGGEERVAEAGGEGDVEGVVVGNVVAQGPCGGRQRTVRVALAHEQAERAESSCRDVDSDVARRRSDGAARSRPRHRSGAARA